MFFNRKKDDPKSAQPQQTEQAEAKDEKKGFFSFFSRTAKEPDAAVEPGLSEAIPEQAEPQTLPEDSPLAHPKVAHPEAAHPEVIRSEVSQPKASQPRVTRPQELAKQADALANEPVAADYTNDEGVEDSVTTTPEPTESLRSKSSGQLKEKPKAKGWFARIKQGLSRTSNQFAEGLGNLLLGKKTIDDELFEELETQLLVADVGIDATTEIIDELTDSVARKQLKDSDALYEKLQTKLLDMLAPVEQPLVIDTTQKPYVILVVGVNGVGKTTTIGKLAYQLRQEGKSVMLAAGDTFRAAAVEQLQVWGERNDIHVVAQHTGADSASVIYDAVSSAKAKNLDVVICDTAGRLHNKAHLMDELAKVRRVITKLDGTAPHEVLLVLDAGTGQNAVSQAEHFRTTAGVSGLVLTKLDGTAKGGVIFALSQKYGLPVRFIGVGESIEDLQPFRAKPFVDALFNRAPEAGDDA